MKLICLQLTRLDEPGLELKVLDSQPSFLLASLHEGQEAKTSGGSLLFP